VCEVIQEIFHIKTRVELIHEIFHIRTTVQFVKNNNYVGKINGISLFLLV